MIGTTVVYVTNSQLNTREKGKKDSLLSRGLEETHFLHYGPKM